MAGKVSRSIMWLALISVKFSVAHQNLVEVSRIQQSNHYMNVSIEQWKSVLDARIQQRAYNALLIIKCT